MDFWETISVTFEKKKQVTRLKSTWLEETTLL